MASIQAIIPRLKALSFFEWISESDISRIMSEGELCVFEAGTILFHEGDQEVEKAYVILSGGVDVTIDGESVASLSVWEIFGEYAIVSREARTATVTTRETTACVAITEDLLLHLVSEYASVNDTLLGRIKDNIRNSRGVFRGC